MQNLLKGYLYAALYFLGGFCNHFFCTVASPLEVALEWTPVPQHALSCSSKVQNSIMVPLSTSSVHLVTAVLSLRIACRDKFKHCIYSFDLLRKL